MANKKKHKRNASVSTGRKPGTKQRNSSLTEQRKIERMLGEEFDSLAEARRALKRESIVVDELVAKRIKESKKVDKQIRKQQRESLGEQQQAVTQRLPIRTIKEISPRTKKDINAALFDSSKVAKLDATLKKGQYVAASVPVQVRNKQGKIETRYFNTKALYTTYRELFKKLAEYARNNNQKGVSKQATTRWLNTIKVFDYTGNKFDYKRQRDAMVAEHRKTKFDKKAGKQTTKNATSKAGKKTTKKTTNKQRKG